MEKFSYVNRTNMEYIEQLFQQYKQDPESLELKWKMFFEGVEFAHNLPKNGAAPSSQSTPKMSGANLSSSNLEKEISAYNLIQLYRDYGSLNANLDPLRLSTPRSDLFDIQRFGLTPEDLNAEFNVGVFVGMGKAPLKDIIRQMESKYCGTLSCHVAQCTSEVRNWFHNEFENKDFALDKEQKKQVYRQLTRTETLERFIHTRYVGTKRFSVEGGDAIIPMLEHLVVAGRAQRVEEIVIGMAHRGRINVLANFMGKGLEVIFAEFDGITKIVPGYDGDVKYHLGFSADKKTPHGDCHISLAFNPSHLEAVDPVVCGMTRAKQRVRKDTQTREKVVPVMIHGDAAFAGQGVVSETLQLSQLDGYKVGGSVHVIINNQVGFTTDPKHARSTNYSSDISKAIRAPVLIVNGDDVEACVQAIDIAIRFRQEFKQDVVIDLICYRRFGHNEGDEPAFTQPVMYKKIKEHPTLRKIYLEKLIQEKSIDEKESEDFYKEKMDNLQEILDDVRKSPPEPPLLAFKGLWEGFRKASEEDIFSIIDTMVDKSVLLQVADTLTTEPSEIKVHSKIKRLINNRKKMVDEDHLDWAMAELLAYGTLCMEGSPVRLSGQDCKRGTFTHRQAVYFDSENGEEHCPLSTLNPDNGEFVVYNSPLSEMAVLGFEYGNSSSDPTYLTIWEAQFGDFANGAQIIIDQFLSSGEEKWARQSGLVLLLPHGYEGQGPEHSSARLERFLQLCAQNNMSVCNFTTPANLFHAFRRQIKRPFRKPMVIMSPKSLLRHPKVVSSMNDLANGQFHEILEDPKVTQVDQIESVVLCSGKVYYDLDKYREDNPDTTGHVAIIRIEQLYPFPKRQIIPYLSGFPNLQSISWVQEEPKNMGAYFFMQPRINELVSELGLRRVRFQYIGRSERASPATGSPKVHNSEQKEIVEMTFKK